MHRLLIKEILWLHALSLVHCILHLFLLSASLSTNSLLKRPRGMVATRSDVRQYGWECVTETECPWSQPSHRQYMARCQHAATLSSPQSYVPMAALRGFLRQPHEACSCGCPEPAVFPFPTHAWIQSGPGWLSQDSDSLQAGQSRYQIQVGARFSAPI